MQTECEPRRPAIRARYHAHPAVLGFTLVEFAVALLILTITLAVVAPSLLGAPSASASCLRSVRGDLERARWTAAREGRRIELRMDGNTRANAPDAGVATPPQLACAAPIEVRGPRDGADRIGFNALGRAYGGPVEIVDAGRVLATIRIDPWTGRLDVEP